MNTAPLAFLDTETTGVHRGRRPWEIAIIRREPGRPTLRHTYQVRDVDLTDADVRGLRVGRFHQRHVLHGVEFAGHAGDEDHVAAWVERMTRDAHLVGIVPSFDAETLDAMLARHRLAPAWHHRLIDVAVLALGHLAARQPDHPALAIPWDTAALSRAVGVEPPGEDQLHTAEGDADWAMRLYDAIVPAPPAHLIPA